MSAGGGQSSVVMIVESVGPVCAAAKPKHARLPSETTATRSSPQKGPSQRAWFSAVEFMGTIPVAELACNARSIDRSCTRQSLVVDEAAAELRRRDAACVGLAEPAIAMTSDEPIDRVA